MSDIEAMYIKGANGALYPATDEDAKAFAHVPVGKGLRVSCNITHNVKFHRKLILLFQLAYNAWDAPSDITHNGQPVAATFDRFRKDLTIISGHYNTSVSFDGKVCLEAKSLSFARMNDDTKGRVYNDVLNTVWSRVLAKANYKTPEEADAIVQRLIGFE